MEFITSISHYKRLHINAWNNFPRDPDQLLPVHFLEQLALADAKTASFEPLSTYLIEYADMAENYLPEFRGILECGKSRNEIFVEYLMNVERLYLLRHERDVLLFIKKLRK